MTMRNPRKFSVGAAVAPALIVLSVNAGAQQPIFGTPDDQRDQIAGICTTQLAIGEGGCACLAGRAMVELDDPQREYLIMSVVQPPVAERLAVARSQADMVAIFTFLDAARQECATVGGAPEAGADDAGAAAPGTTDADAAD